MEGFWRKLQSMLPQSRSISSNLFAILLIYSFFSQFLPIEPYLVPYLTTVKHFSNFQVTVNIYPYGIYSQLIFTLLVAPACLYFCNACDYLIVWGGQSLLVMKIMQITYGFGTAARMVFSSYIFLLVPEEEYQTLTSSTTTISLISFMLASELSQLLAFEKVSYAVFFGLTLASLGICCAATLLLPKNHSSSLWAIAYAGFSLVQNYGTNLFDAINSKSNLNGHVLAASQAAGGLGAFCAVYLENFAAKTGMSIYILGSAVMGVLCMCMGFSMKIWVAYSLYVMISGIYQTLACLVIVRCGRLVSNRHFILLFSVNSFVGLALETLLQAALEILGLSISKQFMSFAGFFFLSTAIFIILWFFEDKSKTVSSASDIENKPLFFPHVQNPSSPSSSPSSSFQLTFSDTQ
ncbi:thiamine transporter 2-like protein [Cinnamomum micranthum f. kanehirae]|uniref:Thiamine transporter 2-like protein n=1 Tax=Cinnamomum micranthum f. kanehirae TaxID=337451 RepID=A0A443PD52_9MAGN|nr:thiamine transporter 2-like protein [Cinnamomum micranthum f. kanehirae]